MKQCTKCKKEKELNCFSKDNMAKDGLRWQCKDCNQEYKHSEKALLAGCYTGQCRRSKKYGWVQPDYTEQELQNKFNAGFHKLYLEYKLSGYVRLLAPSFNRLDDYKSYTLGNLECVTWKENMEEAGADRKSGINNKVSKAVLQYSLDNDFIKEYYSMKQAERETNIFGTNICRCCKGKLNTSGGYKWQYKEAV